VDLLGHAAFHGQLPPSAAKRAIDEVATLMQEDANLRAHGVCPASGHDHLIPSPFHFTSVDVRVWTAVKPEP
jgi:hypothetical protein